MLIGMLFFNHVMLLLRYLGLENNSLNVTQLDDELDYNYSQINWCKSINTVYEELYEEWGNSNTEIKHWTKLN